MTTFDASKTTSRKPVDYTMDEHFGEGPIELNQPGESDDDYLLNLAMKKVTLQKEASTKKTIGKPAAPKKPSPEELKKKEDQAKLDEEAKTDP